MVSSWIRMACQDLEISSPDTSCADAVRRAWDLRTKPPGSLGRLEELAVRLAGIQKTPHPRAARRVLRVFAGAHGVADYGVSAFPGEVNAAMLANFRAGGAAISVLCKLGMIDFAAIDCGVSKPTRPLHLEAAMSEEEFLEALMLGASSVPDEADIFALGEMGIGNTTAAACLSAFLLDRSAEAVTGRGTGIADEVLQQKIGVVHQALVLHRDAANGDAGEWLRRVGGREMVAMVGASLRAASRGIPVILDGVIATAAVAAAVRALPVLQHYLVAAHLSPEPAHGLLLDALGLRPLLDLEMRLGEGTGAALGMNLVQASVCLFKEMATFESAGVPTG